MFGKHEALVAEAGRRHLQALGHMRTPPTASREDVTTSVHLVLRCLMRWALHFLDVINVTPK